MKIIKLIIKGILMYSTLIYWLFAIAFADSYTATITFTVFGIGFILILMCSLFLSMGDVAILTGNNPKELEDEI